MVISIVDSFRSGKRVREPCDEAMTEERNAIERGCRVMAEKVCRLWLYFSLAGLNLRRERRRRQRGKKAEMIIDNRGTIG